MENRRTIPHQGLLLLAAACALALAALLGGTAWADDALAGGFTPVEQENAAAIPSDSLEENATQASSINIENTPQSLAANQMEYVPFPFTGYVGASDNAAMLAKVNALRAASGAGSLAWNGQLSFAAVQRAAEIAFYFDHSRPYGGSWNSVAPDYAHGENIAYIVQQKGMDSVYPIFTGWSNSQGHHANMVNANFKSTALGHQVVDLGGGYELHLWVQLFSCSAPEGQMPTTDSRENFIIPLPTDVAKSVWADPSNLLLDAYGSLHPTIVIQYGESPTLMANPTNCLLIPNGTVGWDYSVGTFKAENPNIVSFDPQSQTLICGKEMGSTQCTATLKSAPSISVTYTVTNSPFARLAGNSSAQTAATIAMQMLRDEGRDSSEFAVIARNDDFADAMSATGLAGHLKAPILLTSRTVLSDATADAIASLGVKKVYIVGGPGAILPAVESSINAMGVTTERVFGYYPWDTSLECAKMIDALGGNPKGEAIIAMSTNFQDALSISPLAYRDAIPILLQGNGTTIPRELTEGEFEFITQKTSGTIWVPGGPKAVPEAGIEDLLGDKSPYKREIVRMYGYDGYDTSLEIAQTLVDRGRANAECVVVASGAQAPRGVDALAGAALAGSNNGVILLVNANSKIEGIHKEAVDGFLVNGPAGSTFMQAFRNGTSKGYMLGGSYVMPYEYEAELALSLAGK